MDDFHKWMFHTSTSVNDGDNARSRSEIPSSVTPRNIQLPQFPPNTSVPPPSCSNPNFRSLNQAQLRYQKSMYPFVKTSNLNPNAQPFNPSFSSRNYRQNDASSSFTNAPVYDRFCPPNTYNNFQLFVPEQAPLNFTPYMGNASREPSGLAPEAHAGQLYSDSSSIQQFSLSPCLRERLMRSINAKPLQEVQVGLEQLILVSDEFETWASAIRERTSDSCFTEDSLSLTVEMIIQMAVLSPSSQQAVQYNLAKLCVLICNDLENFQDNVLVPTILYFRNTCESNMKREQLLNLLLFFAEVYEKLKETSGSRSLLEQAFYEQMKNFLSNSLDDGIIKSVVQALKLTGRHLDNNKGGSSKVDDLLTTLNAISVAHPAISDIMKKQIVGLNSLRESGWGVRNVGPSLICSESQSDTGLTPSSSSGCIIWPDGQPLSEEERAFVDENISKLEGGFDMNDENDLSDEYDEFLSNIEKESLAGRVRCLENSLTSMSLDNFSRENGGATAATNINNAPTTEYDTTNENKRNERQ